MEIPTQRLSATSWRRPHIASGSPLPLPEAATPSDQVSLTSSCNLPAAAPVPSNEPTRRPKDVTGLDKVLAQVETFAEREYFNAEKDGKARDAYYQNIDWKADGKTLFQQLAEKLKSSHTKELNYRPSEHLYPWVDLHPDGQLKSLYSQTSMSPAKAIVEDWEVGQTTRLAENAMTLTAAAFSPEAAAVALATQETAALNCEHVVPQSWFNKAQPQRGDLHHLFACEQRCNSWRGNLPYDEFKKADDNWREQCGSVGPGRTFEPLGGKGAAARATLYFMIRYPGAISRYDADDINMMLDWSRRFPPDLWEKHRNAAIEELQGNRNPLIDYPDLAANIDFRQGLRGRG